MKKFFYMISTVAFMASFASCNKMEQGNTPAEAPSIDGTTTITVSATVPQTKVIFLGKDQQTLRWTSGDLVTLFGENGTALTSTAPNTATSNNFTFSGWPVEDTPKYLVYNGPSSNEVEEGKLQNGNAVRPPVFEDGKFIMTVKGSQQISNDYSFGKHENLSIGALEGIEGAGYTTVMKNVCGVIKFSFANNENIQVKNVLIRNVDASAAPLVGMVKVDYNNGEPTAEVIDGTGKTEVLVKAKGGGIFDNKYYCACVLPGIYEPEIVLNYDIEGVEPITLKAKDGAKIEIKRNEIFDFGTIDNIKLPEQPGTGDGGDDPVVPEVDTKILDIDFRAFSPALPTGSTTTKNTYTLTIEEETYSFTLYSPAKGYWLSGVKLRLVGSVSSGDNTGYPGYMTLPGIAGYRLTSVMITGGNTSGTKTYRIFDKDPIDENVTDEVELGSVAIKQLAEGTIQLESTIVGHAYYLCCLGMSSDSNAQMSKLVLTYSK